MTLFSKFSQAAAVAILTATLAANTARGNGVRISFQPGDGAAPQGVSPSQCTWSDRALRPGEPTTICDNSASAAQYVSLLV